MSGLEGFALGAAPLAGGVLLGGMAGKGTDLRAVIKSDLDLPAFPDYAVAVDKPAAGTAEATKVAGHLPARPQRSYPAGE